MRMKISVMLEVIPQTSNPEELQKFLTVLSTFNHVSEPNVNVEIVPEVEINTDDKDDDLPWDDATNAALQEAKVTAAEITAKLRIAKRKVGSETLGKVFKKHGYQQKVGQNPPSDYAAIDRLLSELIEAAESAEEQETATPQPPAKPVTTTASDVVADDDDFDI